MENKINVAKIIKNWPPGIELDSTIIDELYFDKVIKDDIIKCYTKQNGIYNSLYFYPNGSCLCHTNAKCVIFPKGKTTWKGFESPCQFKDGDILTTNLGSIFILKEPNEKCYTYSCYIALYNTCTCIIKNHTQFCAKKGCRLATEEEKQKLFNVIKENGYKWNAETKTLEKLIKPKFKVGDKVRHKTTKKQITITKIHQDCYEYSNRYILPFEYQDDYELVPEKFDINTLVPFESKVLVRHTKDSTWCGSFFSHIEKDFHTYCNKFVTVAGKSYPMMIPYEGNEHLIGKNKDCDEFYKTW